MMITSSSCTSVQGPLFQQPSEVSLHALLDDVQGAQPAGVSGQRLPERSRHLVNPHHVFVVQPPGDLHLPQGVLHRHRVAHHQLLNGHALPGALVHGRQHQACDAHAQRSKIHKVAAQVEAVERDGGVWLGHGSSR